MCFGLFVNTCRGHVAIIFCDHDALIPVVLGALVVNGGV
jgi:hypothetical protein